MAPGAWKDRLVLESVRSGAVAPCYSRAEILLKVRCEYRIKHKLNGNFFEVRHLTTARR